MILYKDVCNIHVYAHELLYTRIHVHVLHIRILKCILPHSPLHVKDTLQYSIHYIWVHVVHRIFKRVQHTNVLKSLYKFLLSLTCVTVEAGIDFIGPHDDLPLLAPPSPPEALPPRGGKASA